MILSKRATISNSFFVALLLALIFAWPAKAQTPSPTPTATPQPANNGLYSCWPMSEYSGTRADVAGSNHLTDVNTVGYAGGKWGNAASFVAANSEQLTIPFNDSLNLSGYNWTWAVWVRFTRNANEIVWNQAGQFGISHFATGKLVAYLGGIGIGDETVPLGTWTLVWIWDDGLTGHLQINNGPEYQTPGKPNYSGSPNLIFGGVAGQYFDGAIDEPVYWRRALTANERAWIFDQGRGRPCSQIVNPPTPTAISYTQRNIPLSSGDEVVIERAISYGDLAIFTGLGLLIVVIIVSVILVSNRGWFK